MIRTPLFPLALLLAGATLLAACGPDEPSKSEGVKIDAFEVTPDHLPQAGEVKVQWRTLAATSIDLLLGDQAIDLGEVGVAEGSILVHLDETAILTLIASGATGEPVTTSRTVTVDTPPAPSIAELSAPEVVQADETGEATATLSWAGVERATELTLQAPGRAPIELDPGAAEGSLDVTLSQDTTFELVAKNEAGTFSLTAAVRVAALPVIVGFDAERSLVGFGETNSVEWSTTGAVHVELWLDGVQVNDAPDLPAGSFDAMFTISSTLELRAFNELETMATATVNVDVGAPVIVDLQLSSSSLWMEEQTVLSWETLGGSALDISLDGSGETICEETAYGNIETSSCTWQPLEPGVYPLTLTVSNGSGVVDRVAEVFAADGPLIVLFDANPEVYTAGDELELRWEVRGDPSGGAPSLRLTDDRGGSCDADEPAGLLFTELTQPGTYRLQLEATTDHPDASPDLATIDLVVHPRPAVTFEATPSHFDDSVDEQVVLSWISADAQDVILYRLVDGSPVQLLEALGAEREAGSYSFVPDAAATFRLVATNTIGGSTSVDREVTLAPTEVLVAEADPTTFTQGQQILLRWTTRMADEVTIDAGSKGYLLEETAAPYLDLPTQGGTHLPMTAACGAIETLGCAQLGFPDGFIFPFGGTSYQEVWIHTTGYLGFTDGSRPESLPQNLEFPTEPRYARISLAPFWDALGWDPARFPAGNIYTALLEEDGARIFVIQWRDIGYDLRQSPGWRTASLNFEVVLREDGSFDFRYGSPSARDSGIDTMILDGFTAAIGFQLPDQSDSHQIAYRLMADPSTPRLNGPVAQRTFSYRPLPPLPSSGELLFSPFGDQANFAITVTATRDGVSHSKEVNLTVAHKPLLELSPEALTPVGMGEEFRIGWRTSNADALVVVDEVGTIRCTAQNQSQIQEGLCALSEEVAGSYEYTVRATGANGFVVERKIPMIVFGAFGVATFTADAASIEKGSDVLLRWQVFDADSVTLYADGRELFTDPSGAPSGSFLAEGVEEETEFKLVVKNEVGAADEATLTVGLWELTFGLQASATTVRPGEPITLSFDARTLDGGAPVRVYGLLPLLEIDAPADRYEDISGHPQAVNLGINPNASSTIVDVNFPAGFSFPYMGQDHTRLRAFVDGYVSFVPSAIAYNNNQRLPSAFEGSTFVQLAPFWDDLHPRGVGQMHSALIDPDTFVIQWSKMSLNGGSNNLFPHDLNFQLVLRRDGSFDYRYGTMAPHPTNRPSSGCFPDDCVNEVNGSAASIGYQTVQDAIGYGYHFGGTTPAPGNQAVPGGLGGKTLRYPSIEGSGSFTFHPQRSGTFNFCANAAAGPRCRELQIEVPFGIRSAALSEIEIGFGESVTLRWESAGGRVLNVLDGETVLFTTSDPATIDQGSFTFSPLKDTLFTVELRSGLREQRVQRLVEIRRASMTATATTSAGPGSPVTISWNLTPIQTGVTFHVAAPMEELSGSAFYTYDLSNDTGATRLTYSADDHNATLDFVDFTFPYFGTNHSSIQVATDGYLNWETGSSAPGNVAIPNPDPAHSGKAIAPFWEDLHTRLTGEVFAKKLDADRYVIQWSAMSLRWGSSNTNMGNLNFLVVLHRDGSFEFHYGTMERPPLPGSTGNCHPANCESETNGASATIGYQTPGGTAGHQLHFGGTDRAEGQAPVAGGLSLRAWRFTPRVGAATGSAQVHPASSTRYRICAYDPASGDASCAPTLGVDVPWGIDLFQVNPAAPLAGQPVTLSWSVRGLDLLRILVDGAELARHEAPNIPALGTLTHTPGRTVTYTLEGSSMDRTIALQRVVQERAFDLTITNPSGTYFPGEVAEVRWELTQHLPGVLTMITPMGEIPAGAGAEGAFVDVRSLPGAQQLALQSLDGGPPSVATVPLPFSFPYLGALQSSVEVLAFGYLSFGGMAGPGFPFNTGLPSAEMTDMAVHIAPFWDLMVPLASGDGIWRYSPNADTLIFQWKISRWEPTGAGGRYDLNFQVVLRSDGSFDYRYGTMAPPPQPFSFAGCMPSTCVDEANGSSATIGYQGFNGARGYTLHFGSQPDADRYLAIMEGVPDGLHPFPGGISHRSFRYTPASTGSARLVVGAQGTQEVCAILGDYVRCEPVRIEVVASPGELMITELMIDPAAGVAGQWLEVRNLTNRAIDLQGLELRSSQGSHLIATPLPLPAGGFATLASSADLPFTPTYVYGADVPLDRLIDELQLLAGGTPIHTVRWGAGWSIPRDQALSLDPSLHLNGVLESSDFAAWCNAGSGGSPGAPGIGCSSSWYDIDPRSDRAFLDIAATGSRFYDLESDGSLARLPATGFELKYFGESFSRLWVSSNGWLSPSDTRPSTDPTTPAPILPDEAEDLTGPLIAPFWSRLFCGDDCRVFYERTEVAGEEVLILQWQGFHLGSAADPGSITFQLQLWERGDLVVAFGPIDAPHLPGDPAHALYEGGDGWIGLLAPDPTISLTALYRQPLGLEGRSILFRAR